VVLDLGLCWRWVSDGGWRSVGKWMVLDVRLELEVGLRWDRG
jgi:hypothetical protein